LAGFVCGLPANDFLAVEKQGARIPAAGMIQKI
jgi:hypothetical protein